MDMKTLTGKQAAEIVAAVPELNDAEKAELLEIELERTNKRKTVLDALGYEPPAEESSEEDDGVEKLDFTKEFNMVHHNGYKHYFQDGKVFDRVSKERIA